MKQNEAERLTGIAQTLVDEHIWRRAIAECMGSLMAIVSRLMDDWSQGRNNVVPADMRLEFQAAEVFFKVIDDMGIDSIPPKSEWPQGNSFRARKLRHAYEALLSPEREPDDTDADAENAKRGLDAIEAKLDALESELLDDMIDRETAREGKGGE